MSTVKKKHIKTTLQSEKQLLTNKINVSINICAYVVYILGCVDGTLYTGSTKNLVKRIKEHNTGTKGAKYTRYRRPVTLLYSREFGNVGCARREEILIKRLSRKEKLLLIDTLSVQT